MHRRNQTLAHEMSIIQLGYEPEPWERDAEKFNSMKKSNRKFLKKMRKQKKIEKQFAKCKQSKPRRKCATRHTQISQSLKQF